MEGTRGNATLRGNELIIEGEAEDVCRERDAAKYPHDTIVSVKRFMGRGPQDAETTRRFVVYINPPPARGSVDRLAALYDRLTARVGRMPGSRALTSRSSPRSAANITT